MDEATKAGYGVLLMRQALPKSEFYARTTANIRAGLQEPASRSCIMHPLPVSGKRSTLGKHFDSHTYTHILQTCWNCFHWKEGERARQVWKEN